MNHLTAQDMPTMLFTYKTSDSAAAIATGGDLFFQFLDDFHRHMHAELLNLNRLADELAQGGEPSPALRQRLKDAVHWFYTMGELHHRDEEMHVFPALLASSDRTVTETAYRLRQDHGWIEQTWLETGLMLLAVIDGSHSYDADAVCKSVRRFTQFSLDHLILEVLLAYPEARERVGVTNIAAASRQLMQRHKASTAASPAHSLQTENHSGTRSMRGGIGCPPHPLAKRVVLAAVQ
jgi:iron-sulfur cluster repair protein YtfE (RIC family)